MRSAFRFDDISAMNSIEPTLEVALDRAENVHCDFGDSSCLGNRKRHSDNDKAEKRESRAAGG